MVGQAVAIGGVSADTDDSALDRFVLDLAGVAQPRVCFLPTASGDAAAYEHVEDVATAFVLGSHTSSAEVFVAIGCVRGSHHRTAENSRLTISQPSGRFLTARRAAFTKPLLMLRAFSP
jgi:hypothetical protein